MSKVFVVSGSGYFWPHEEFGEFAENINDLEYPQNISLIVFTGGADINPSLYKHQKNPKSYCSEYRDTLDLKAFKVAQDNNIPCVGICRGGQFLTAMAGGFLFQDVNNHGMCRHNIKTIDDKIFSVSGDHHQMFGMPLPKDAELLAWASPKISTKYELGGGDYLTDVKAEPEVVYYPGANSLAVQYHPEWMEKNSAGVKYYQKLIKEKLLK